MVCVHAFNDVSQTLFEPASSAHRQNSNLLLHQILYPVLFEAVIGAGGCFTGTNPAYTVSELVHHFRTSRTRFVVVEQEHLDMVLKAAADCRVESSNVFVLARPETPLSQGYRSWEELLQHGEADWVRLNGKTRKSDIAVALFSTSGTTGLPKMAARSHKSLIAESIAIKDPTTKPYQVYALYVQS